ncbi:hypothetical protein EJB05_04677, partial [Eragrostis curvula]
LDEQKLQTMAINKLALPVVLLLCGLMVDGCCIKNSEAGQGRFCPMYCLNAAYMTCKSTGDQHLDPACNCCVVEKKGCTIYLNDGQPVKCS